MSKCPTCNDEFSEEFKIPKVLPCGHTYCIICLVSIFQSQKAFVCLECRHTIVDPSILPKLPHNFAILKCIQQMKAQNSFNNSPSAFFSQSGSNPFLDMHDTINFSPSYDTFKSYSPTKATPFSDSFNFNGFKALLESAATNKEKLLSRSFTMPGRERSRTPPRKINEFEINEKGIFREKTPQKVREVCSIKGCNNEKLYMKGSLQPFCQFHTAQFSGSNPSEQGLRTPDKIFQSQGFPQQSSAFKNFGQSQSMNNSMNNSHMATMHTSNSFQGFPQNSQETVHRPVHMFGKPTELMGLYDKTPATNRNSGMPSFSNSVATTNTNSSVFSGFDHGEKQKIDFGKLNMSKFGVSTPFPTINEQINTSQTNEQDNTCPVPGCQNKRLVHAGILWPVCSNKCYRAFQSQNTHSGGPFWT